VRKGIYSAELPGEVFVFSSQNRGNCARIGGMLGSNIVNKKTLSENAPRLGQMAQF
jgi:hypothetical protein